MSVRLTEAAAEVYMLRREALAARERYDATLRGFIKISVLGGPVSEFTAAEELGWAGGSLAGVLSELDEAGDTDGFDAGFRSAAALRALIEGAG